MSASLATHLPLPVLTGNKRPWYSSLLLVDRKIVGKDVEISLMRSTTQEWSSEVGEYVYAFYVAVYVPNGDQIEFVTNGDTDLVGAVKVYEACNDKWFM